MTKLQNRMRRAGRPHSGASKSNSKLVIERLRRKVYGAAQRVAVEFVNYQRSRMRVVVHN